MAERATQVVSLGLAALCCVACGEETNHGIRPGGSDPADSGTSQRREGAGGKGRAGMGGAGTGGHAGTPASRDAGPQRPDAPEPRADAGSTWPTSPREDAGSDPPPPTCPEDATLAPGDASGTLRVGDTTREYLVHVPPGYTGNAPVPLLIDWHALHSGAQYQRESSGYAEVADREGFLVAYPEGIDNAWNIGPCCTRSRDVDDFGFAMALLDALSREACIDRARVYAAGFSMGGGMSHALACKAADTFAAVAPAAFDLIEEIDCQPSRPISVISFRGTADLIVPYDGGPSTPPTGYPLPEIHFLGAEGSFERWAELDECAGAPVPVTDGCQSYEQCAAGVEVTLCTTQGGGHVTGDAELAWERLRRHTLP